MMVGSVDDDAEAVFTIPILAVLDSPPPLLFCWPLVHEFPFPLMLWLILISSAQVGLMLCGEEEVEAEQKPGEIINYFFCFVKIELSRL